ncbi:hypothetical protein KJ840_01150 [Patescibacteria group bacterium]|nr:hypothetical protein [Patescibacteria group bacterium]
MKNRKEKLNTILYITVCFILVVATAKIMALARDNFEENQRVIAETLPSLPSDIQQNQIRYLIEEGYLTEPELIVKTSAP